MKSKTVLVTGATDGIGKETALRLARQGARVLLAGRNPEKGARAVSDIRQATGHDALTFLPADLSVQDDVRALADSVKATTDRLDVLVNNAGAFMVGREESSDGIEMTFALNHLNYFLLTDCLLDLLKASGPSRVVSVASIAHRRAALDFDDLQLKNGYGGWKAYSRSKLANVMFTYALARRLEGSGVTANCLHPGFVRSHFGQNNGLLGRLGVSLAMRFGGAISVEQGAKTSIHLASSPDVEGQSGLYFDECKPTKSNRVSYDEAAQERLWQISAELVGL